MDFLRNIFSRPVPAVRKSVQARSRKRIGVMKELIKDYVNTLNELQDIVKVEVIELEAPSHSQMWCSFYPGSYCIAFKNKSSGYWYDLFASDNSTRTEFDINEVLRYLEGLIAGHELCELNAQPFNSSPAVSLKDIVETEDK